MPDSWMCLGPHFVEGRQGTPWDAKGRHAKNGMKKLMTTYKDANQKTLLHTLSLYHNILELNNEKLFESKDHADVINIDQVFKNVKTVYDKKILMITYHTLVLMQETKNEKEILQYMNGIKMILTPTEQNIRNWIQTNLTL